MRSFNSSRTPVAVEGAKWRLDRRLLIDSGILQGGWEPATTAAVRRIVRPGQIVLDIGANIGWYTVVLSRLVGPKGRVLAFEPMPEPAALAREHVRLNGLTNAEIHEIALDDHDHDDRADFTYAWPLDPAKDPIQQDGAAARFRRLDGLVDELQIAHVDFAKIDVDGYEDRLLAGSLETLRRDRPVLLLEVCDYTLRATDGAACWLPREACPDYGSAVRRMLGRLTSLGYQFMREEDFSLTSVDAMLRDYDLSRRSINVVAAARAL